VSATSRRCRGCRRPESSRPAAVEETQRADGPSAARASHAPQGGPGRHGPGGSSHRQGPTTTVPEENLMDADDHAPLFDRTLVVDHLGECPSWCRGPAARQQLGAPAGPGAYFRAGRVPGRDDRGCRGAARSS
jgi:hypothetical protein